MRTYFAAIAAVSMAALALLGGAPALAAKASLAPSLDTTLY